MHTSVQLASLRAKNQDCWLETDAAAAAAALAKLEGQAEVCKADVADTQKQLQAVSGQLGEHTERIRGLQSWCMGADAATKMCATCSTD